MTEVNDRDLYTRGDQQMEHRLGAEKTRNQTKTGEGTMSATQENNQRQMRKIRAIKERSRRKKKSTSHTGTEKKQIKTGNDKTKCQISRKKSGQQACLVTQK